MIRRTIREYREHFGARALAMEPAGMLAAVIFVASVALLLEGIS